MDSTAAQPLDTLLILIPLLPLAAAMLTAAGGKWLLREWSHAPVLAATLGGFLLSLLLLWQVADGVARSPEAPIHPADPDVHQAAGPAARVTLTGDGTSAIAASEDEAAEADDAQAAAAEAAPAIGYERVITLWRWAAVEDAQRVSRIEAVAGDRAVGVPDRRLPLSIDVSLRADPLTCIMLSMVLFVASLVVIYASGYMQGDPGYWRFFTYVALFVFSMTMLVTVSNFALLYVFWEAVGVCSYLLIGFWFEKPEAAAAGKKAFLVNRVGDFGFALGVFLLWTTYGTLNFHDADGVAGVLGQLRLANQNYVGGTVGLAIALCLFLGACGKSAQFPLHVWLPDAMEGPTPVSALIHAATMVTAGVYMVARCTPLFLPLPDVPDAWAQQALAHQVVAVVGGLTALLAGLIAVTQTDLKRVLAYSTVSQLGYMFLALGTASLAGVVAGMFHLFTHAFFKALLFLGAGSVMHAMGGVIDIRRFGGLRRIMPATHWTFLFGCLALAGILPFAGFWSKDAILAAVHAQAHPHGGTPDRVFQVLYYAALFTAFLTAFYTFRAYFRTFFGRLLVPPEAGHHAHESPLSMTGPLKILAVGALGVGVYFEWTHGFREFLVRTPSLAFAPARATVTASSFAFHADVATLSTLIALSGIALAAFFYLGERQEIGRLTSIMQWLKLYPLSHGKFFFDQIYQGLIVWPLEGLAALSYWVDRRVIDGLVNFCGRLPVWLGLSLRGMQGGLVQSYALFTALGLVVVLIGTLVMWQPEEPAAEPPPAATVPADALWPPPAAESLVQREVTP